MNLKLQTFQPTGPTHSGTVIFLHGSCHTGSYLWGRIRYLVGNDWMFPHIKVIMPTAPSQPYTPQGGQYSTVWFDRTEIAKGASECRASLKSAYENYIKEIIKSENDNGIPTNRIIIGGFSMGGGLALATLALHDQELAGTFVCSSFLNDKSIAFDTLQTRKFTRLQTQPNCGHSSKLLMFHGNCDDVVPLSWAKETFDRLVELGVDGEFRILENTQHDITAKELRDLREWIVEKLPPLDSDKR